MANTQSLAKFDSQKKELICQGEWNLTHIEFLEKELEKISWPTSGEIAINGKAITKMDIAGAWLLKSWLQEASKNVKFNFQDFPERYKKLLTIIEKEDGKITKIPKKKKLKGFAAAGKYIVTQHQELREYFTFIGKLTHEALRITLQPVHLRFREFASVIYKDGFKALFIIGLLAFMVGIVIAYQFGLQLQKYGANVYVVDLVGYAILREFSPLLTAIMVAGRTGSAFTAQIGTMKVTQEIDALDTMGVTPSELLILPRIAALFVTLPLLVMWANIFGVWGGMIMSSHTLGIGFDAFITRFQEQVPVRSLIIGLGKAPLFALIIASVGCFQGMQVELKADDVGKKTTRSVVLSIFFIILVDAILSLIFSKWKL